MSDADLDAIVVGAGFSGLYALHRLREQGLRVRLLELNERGTDFERVTYEVLAD